MSNITCLSHNILLKTIDNYVQVYPVHFYYKNFRVSQNISNLFVEFTVFDKFSMFIIIVKSKLIFCWLFYMIRGNPTFPYQFYGKILLKHIEGKFIGRDMYWIFNNTDLLRELYITYRFANTDLIHISQFICRGWCLSANIGGESTLENLLPLRKYEGILDKFLRKGLYVILLGDLISFSLQSSAQNHWLDSI